MKKMMKLAAILVTMALVLAGATAAAGGVPETVATDTQNGITYTLDTEGALTVTGESTGATGTDFTGIVTGFPSSFGSHRSDIIRIVIGPNITGVGNTAFAGFSNLESLEVGEGVTTLGQHAFAGNSKLQNVTLPSTLTELGYGAFTSCRALTGISLPDGLKQIGDYAFAGCSLLAEISLPEELESIGSYAFGGCNALTELTIPNTVSSLGTDILSGCSLIKSITLPSALETVPDNAFSYNSYLEEVVIPSGVKELGSGAFQSCINLSTVTIGEGLETIGSTVFQGCSALTEITLPASLTTIGNGAFSSSLETVTILSDNVAIAENAFAGYQAKIRCSHASAAAIYANDHHMELEYLDPAIVTVNGVTYVLDPDSTLTITGDGENGTGTGGLGIVDTLPGWIYNERNSIVKIVLGGDIENVTCAFQDCTNLTAVEIGGSVKTLGDGVFRNCSNLTAVTIGEGLENIGADAFQGCTELTAIRLPASLQTIGGGAFDTALTKATILSMDTDIGEDAFTDQLEAILCYEDSTADDYAAANGITAIHFGKEMVLSGITYVLDAAGTLTVTGDGENGTGTNGLGVITELPDDCNDFRNDIVNVVIGENIESIGDHTGHMGPFANLPNLVSAEISEGVTDLGTFAFYNSANLRSVQLPSTLKRIGYNAFMRCASLTGLILPDGLEAIGSYVFDNCTSLEELVFPSTVTSMGYPMVGGCSSLKKVTLPASMENMTNNLMQGCSGLEEVIIPAGIKALGTQLFQDCINLHTVTIEEGLETIGNAVFQNCPNLKAIVLPASLKEIRNAAFEATLETATILSDDAVIGDTAFKGYQAKLRCNYDSTAGVYARAHGMEREYLDIDGDFVVRDGVLVEYTGSGTELVIPAECEGQAVTAIGETVFAGGAFTSVSIPGSVKTIGRSAFTNNESLETLTIGEGTETIGDSAFLYCTNLTHVSLPSTLTVIGEHAFQNDSSLAAVTLPEGLTELGYMAFRDCTSLQEITIPGSVTSIGDLVFSRCTGLQTVTVEEGVTNLGIRTFYMDNNSSPALTSVSLPEGLLVIGDTCFAFNTRLTDVTLPSTLTTIGQAAFLGTALTEVTIPAGVADVPSAAFDACNNLKTVTLTGENTTIDISNIYNADDIWCPKNSATMAGLLAKQVYGPYRIHCIGLPDYAVNENGALIACNMHATDHNVPQAADGIPVTTLAAGAFADDEWPETIQLPEGLTTVESGVMSNLGHLGKVRFPASLSAIPANTISGCPNLNCVVILNPEAVIDENAFPGVTEMIIFCHAGSTAEAFAQRKGFSIEYISGSFVTDGNGTLLEYIGNETEVTIPEGIVSIGRSAFKGAAGVQTVILPESLTSIGQYAFYGCSQLSLIVYSGAENEFAGIDIGYDAIDSNVTVYCQLLWREKITEESDESDIRLTLKRDGILYAEGTGEIRSGMMPDTIPYGSGGNDSPVQRGAKNRSGSPAQGSGEEPEINTSALPLVIGEGITALRTGAIESCEYICTVQIPASMTEIEPMALYNNQLQEVTAAGANPAYASAEGVLFTKDGETLVQYPARRQGSYAIPEGVARIGNYAFYDAFIPALTLPSTLTTIGEGAFSYARTDYQARFTVPDGLRTIEAEAFRWYDGPDYLVMPESLETVGDNAFSGTSSCIIFTESPRSFGTEEDGFTLFCYPDSTAKEWGDNNNCNVCMINADLFRDYGGTIEMPEKLTLRTGQETEISVTLQPSFFSRIPVTLTVGNPNSPGTQIAQLSQADGKYKVRAIRQGISYINVAVGFDEASPNTGFTEEIRLMVPYSFTMLTGQGIFLTDGSYPNFSCEALPEGQDVLDIDGEYIEALKPGQVTVTAKYYGGIEISYVITVVSGSQVKLPQELTIIEEDAFNGDTNLRFVELPQNVQTVKAGAFANIGDINVNVLSTNIQLEEGAFSGSNPVFFIPVNPGLEVYLNGQGYLYFYNQ